MLTKRFFTGKTSIVVAITFDSSILPVNPLCSFDREMISAPRLAMMSILSLLSQLGIKIATGWPRARPMAAKDIPVLPLVVCTILRPYLMLPVRLQCSHFAQWFWCFPDKNKELQSSVYYPPQSRDAKIFCPDWFRRWQAL